MVECPHCGGQTTLLPGPPADAVTPGNSPVAPKRKIPVVLGAVVLIGFLAAAGVTLRWFKQPEAIPPVPRQTTPPAPAPEDNDLLQAGPVTLQKTEGSALIYAMGTIRNNSNRQRFGVKIELDLLDGQDQKIGTAGDYIAILEPHKDWQFRALLTQPKAVKVQVAKIVEQK